MTINPEKGLPKKIFYEVSSLTPLICVDLLIQDSKKGIILTWRDDKYYGPGWHIPGGIIRFKEKIIDRIKATLLNELRIEAKKISKKPLKINEQINTERNIRGHFLALLFECKIKTEPPINLKFNYKNKVGGTWKWHKRFPKKMIKQHYIYKDFFKNF